MANIKKAILDPQFGKGLKRAATVTTSMAKRALKKLSTPTDATEGGKYEVTRQGSQLIRTRVKK